MIYQNDKNCLPIIQTSGCFFRSCAILAEKLTNKSLSANDLNTLWKELQERDIICNKKAWSCSVEPYQGYTSICSPENCHLSNKCKYNNITASALVINHILKYLGSDKTVFETATVFYEDGRVKRYDYGTKLEGARQLIIRKIKQSGPQGVHFLALWDNKEIDPHDPPIKNLGRIYDIIYSVKE